MLCLRFDNMINNVYNSNKSKSGERQVITVAEKFNDRIAELLKEKDMTQRDLARKIGVTDSAMSHYIKGDRVPRAAVILLIADVLETSPDYIMYGKPSNKEAEIDQAVRLIARNSEQLSHEDKVRIMNILLGDK